MDVELDFKIVISNNVHRGLTYCSIHLFFYWNDNLFHGSTHCTLLTFKLLFGSWPTCIANEFHFLLCYSELFIFKGDLFYSKTVLIKFRTHPW